MGHVATEILGQQFFGVDGFGGGLAPTRFPSGRQSPFVRAAGHLDGIVSGWCSAFVGAWSVRGSGQGRPSLGQSEGDWRPTPTLTNQASGPIRGGVRLYPARGT